MTWTVQKLIDGNMRSHVYCENPDCLHNAELDHLALRDRLGPEAPMMRDDILPKLRCSKCGGKKLDIKLSPGGTLMPGGAHSHRT